MTLMHCPICLALAALSLLRAAAQLSLLALRLMPTPAPSLLGLSGRVGLSARAC